MGSDEQTLEIRAAEFTTSDVGDAPMLPELLDQIPADQEIGSVTADGAFDTRKCHDRCYPWRCPWRCRDHSTAQERHTVEARYRRGNRPQRGPARITPLRSDHLATMERLSPPKAASKYEEDQKTIRGIVFPTIGCTVSNCRANAWPLRTSTVRSPSSRSMSPS